MVTYKVSIAPRVMPRPGLGSCGMVSLAKGLPIKIALGRRITPEFFAPL